MYSILTVIGQDRVGIIAGVSNIFAEANINILDIDQTVMKEYFTMIMLVDIKEMNIEFNELQNKLTKFGEDMALSIRLQKEEIFKKMYEI